MTPFQSSIRPYVLILLVYRTKIVSGKINIQYITIQLKADACHDIVTLQSSE